MENKKIKNMEEFAKISGISRPTVSKYFNDPNSVRQSTRKCIEKALEQHDYRPNIFAVNQNRKLTKNIGIVVPFLADPFFAEIARRIEHRCIELGYRPTLYSSHGDKKLENEILDSLRSLKPTGVLLAPLGRASDIGRIEKFCKDIPTVLFDSRVPIDDLAFIGSNNTQFSKLIVEYLCRSGEPPCYFEMKTPPNPNANKRRQGYINAMEALGHEPQIIQVPGEGWLFEEVGRKEGIKVLKEKLIKSNTVLFNSDRLAIGFLTACYEMGIQVGHDEHSQIRVAGQDDHPYARYTCPPLTTVAHDYDKITSHSVDTLFKAIEEGHMPNTTTLFDGKLLMRDSA